MTAFCPSDVIFATIRQRGTVLATLKLSGISSLTDVIRRIPAAVAGLMGLTIIELRNGTQGWKQRHTIMLSAS